MGIGVAVAVNNIPDSLLSAVSEVEVQERMGDTTTFRLRYPVDINEGDLPLLIEDKFKAGTDVSVLIPTDSETACLVKGPINTQQIHISHGGAGSWMEISGSDSSMKMDRDSKAVVWSDVTDSDAVSSVLSNYGYMLDVESTNSRHLETKHVLVQRESDFDFVRRLARRNGFLFWVTCDGSGTETAHFKAPDLSQSVTEKVVINLITPGIDAIEINWDVERPNQVASTQLDLNTLTEIDGSVLASPQVALGDTNMAAAANNSYGVHLHAPVDDAGDLQARGNAVLANSDWFVTASCQTTVDKLGSLVRSHTIIDLVGAGSRYSGKYFVSGVRHTIDASGHKMALELVRNAWSN